MEAMKALALNNRLVISVIHQPRSSIYSMFDRLLLLSNGRTMYFGQAAEATPYFANAGSVCPALYNPADFFLDVLSPDSRSKDRELRSAATIENFGDLFLTKSQVEPSQVQAASAPPAAVLSCMRPVEPPDFKRLYKNFQILCWRSLTEQLRDTPTLMIRFFTSCFFGLVIGGIYSNTRHNQEGIQNITGLLFIITLNQTFNNVFSVITVFPKEKIIVYRCAYSRYLSASLV